MRLSYSELKEYEKLLNMFFKGRTLGVPALLNKYTFWFPVIDQKESLIINLRNGKPFFSIARIKNYIKPLNDPILNPFRDSLDYFEVSKVTLKEDDYILTFDINIGDEIKEKMVLELFNKKPNLLLLDENNGVLASFLDIDYEVYSYPEVTNFDPKGIDDSDKFNNDRLKEELEYRFNEKYGYFMSILKLRIKKIERALKDEDIDANALLDKAKVNIDLVNDILASGYKLNAHYSKITLYDGRELKLDTSITLKEYVDKLMKESKKLNNRVKLNAENKTRLENHLRFYNDILKRIGWAGGDEEIEKIIAQSGLVRTDRRTKVTPFNVPYKINHNGLIIYFGKNAQQNDYLSFNKQLNREFLWFHVKDYHGAHVVLAKVKPNNKEIELAAMVAVTASKLTTANVTYTLKKNIRKGKAIGEALIKNYTTIKINNIDPIVPELIEKAVKDEK